MNDTACNVLRRVRQTAGLSQAKLSARAGLSEQMVWRYESGLTRPSPAAVLSMARVLVDVGADPTDMLEAYQREDVARRWQVTEALEGRR